MGTLFQVNNLKTHAPANTSTRITIEKDYLHFSCAHFTIFSATKRENLHGHNYHVKCSLDATVGDDGLCFDYNKIKTALMQLCASLDEYTLLPLNSPHLVIEKNSELGEHYLFARFGDEQIPFLTRDVKCLPLRNITIEELSPWMLNELDKIIEFDAMPLDKISLGVSSGAGQWALSYWCSKRKPKADSQEQITE